jgi:transposase-like protein
MEQPRAGAHYPRSTGEFQAWFRTDADCLDYLDWVRWPGGFTCPSCGHAGGWRLGDGRYECAGCRRRTSVTAGTIFDRTRTPLTVWFTACWLFAIQKDGISAQSLQRSLEIGSYPTAWAMLHRLRSVLVRPGRDRLSGTVEVDETFIGGDEPGLRGGRAKGKKVLTGIAVEVAAPKGIGRCRMAVLADASAESLNPFVTGAIEPGSTVITDAWQGYSGLDSLGYTRERRSQRAARARGEDPGELLPAVHRVASLAKRWLLGTHQGSVDENHLPSYLNEFVFRFNRRRSRSRGLVFYRVLELAAGHDPVRFQDLLASKKPRPAPAARGWGHPPSLDRPAANRPWRTGELQLQLPIPLRLSEYPLIGLCRGPDYADAVSGSPGQRGGRCPGIGITRRGSLAVCLSGVVSVSLQTGERAWRRDRAPAASWLATVSGRRRYWRSSAFGWSGSGVCQRRRSAVTATR